MTLEKFDDKYDTYVTLAPNTEPCYNKYHGELCKNNDNVLGRCHDDKKCTSESDFSSDEQELLNDICSDEHEENKLKNKYCVFHDISYVIDARVELTNTFNLGAIDTDDISHCSGENNLCNSKNARGSLCSNSNNNRCFGIPYEKICECKNDDLINNYFNYICSIFSDDLEQNYYKIRHIINENELLYLRNNLDDFCEIVNIEEPFLDDTTHETLPNAASVIQLTSVPEQKEVEGEKALKGKISDKSKSNDVNSKEIIELSKYIENKNINFVETSKNSDDTISFGYDIDNNEQSDLFIITDLLGYVTKVNFNEINHLSHNYGFHFNDPASSGYDVLFYELKSGSNQNLKYISHILYDEEWTYNPNDKTILLEKINFENDFSLSEEEKNAIIQIYSTINLWFENIISNDISMEINNFGGLLNTLEGSTLTISIFNTDYITQIDETKWSGNIDIKFNPEINFYIQYSELKDIPEYNYISEY